jgi:predicted HTH transcriptional regulator
MFPELAIRELVANALIHQDFHLTGTGPMVEIFAGRMEITNPGLPLVQTDRFLDSPPRSRNETLASFMRRIGVCEERGSGIDKVVFQTELFQLPAPLFEVMEQHTRATLFAHRELREMDKTDRIRACYLHACLRYVQRDYMTNTTLRERFGINKENSSIASRIIRDTIEADLIRCHDETVGSRGRKYVPKWA